MTSVRVSRGAAPARGNWPFFSTLAVDEFAEIGDIDQHVALRSAATRAGKKLARTFSVRKETVTKGRREVQVLRVYRTK